jgi:hypothetical protein
MTRRNWLGSIAGAAGLAITASAFAPTIVRAEDANAQTERDQTMDFTLEFPPLATPTQGETAAKMNTVPQLIRLASFSLSATTNPAADAPAGIGVTRTFPSTLEVAADFAADTAAYLEMLTVGQHFDNLILHVRPKPNAADLVTYTLSGATLNNLTLTGQTNKAPVNQKMQFTVIGTTTRAAVGT